MPGPPPPPPPPMMGGPPPPPSLGGLSIAAPDRNALLKSIADPSKPKLKKVDPAQIKDRSKPLVSGGGASSASEPVSVKSKYQNFLFNVFKINFFRDWWIRFIRFESDGRHESSRSTSKTASRKKSIK